MCSCLMLPASAMNLFSCVFPRVPSLVTWPVCLLSGTSCLHIYTVEFSDMSFPNVRYSLPRRNNINRACSSLSMDDQSFYNQRNNSNAKPCNAKVYNCGVTGLTHRLAHANPTTSHATLELVQVSPRTITPFIRSPRWRIRLSSSLVWVSFVSSSPAECILVKMSKGLFLVHKLTYRKCESVS